MYTSSTSPEALRLYHLGGRTFECGVRSTLDEARGYFERSIDIDPTFARAKSWLAYTLVEGWSYGWYPDCDRTLADELADQALELDEGDYQNHWTKAVVLKSSGQIADAETAFNMSRTLRTAQASEDPDLLVEMAEVLGYQGKHDEAIDSIHEAIEMKANVRAGDQTVRVPHPDWYMWFLAMQLYFVNEYQRSLYELAKMTELPNNAYLLQAANYYRLDEQDLAEEEMATHQAREPDWTVSKEKAVEHFQDNDMQHWLDALQGAGLPP